MVSFIKYKTCSPFRLLQASMCQVLSRADRVKDQSRFQKSGHESRINENADILPSKGVTSTSNHMVGWGQRLASTRTLSMSPSTRSAYLFGSPFMRRWPCSYRTRDSSSISNS